MNKDEPKILGEVSESSPPSRRRLVKAIAFGLAFPLTACGQGRKKMRTKIVLNVVMYSYLDRPIYDIFFNGTDLGVANKYGGTGTITGVHIPFGIQTLTWNLDGPDGTKRNGELVRVKNRLVITAEQVPVNTHYVGLHLYPDETAEVTFAEFIPELSERGREISQGSRHHG